MSGVENIFASLVFILVRTPLLYFPRICIGATKSNAADNGVTRAPLASENKGTTPIRCLLICLAFV